MDHRASSERLGEAVNRALRHWRSRGKPEPVEEAGPPAAPPVPSWTIAISRQAGTNAAAVAAAAGERLGWPVYDRELIEMIASEMGLREQLVESADERRVGWLQEFWQSITSGPSADQMTYVHHLTSVLSSLAAHGECVIVGRGAAQILPEEATLRVRLVARLESRVQVVEKRDALVAEAARRRVADTDRARTRFVRDHFNRDPDDPALYDLVLNTGRLSVAACAEVIVAALKRMTYEAEVAGKQGAEAAACPA